MIIQEEPFLSFHNFVIGYGTKKHSKSLSQPFTSIIQRGQLISLIGLNGVGKSTLLRTIAGILPPISGSVTIYGRNIHKLSSVEKSENISVEFPFENARPNLTVLDYVQLGQYRFSDWLGNMQSENDFLEKMIEQFSLQNYLDRKVDELSDGEFQRVELARCIVQQTPLVLLDEPTSHMDYPSREMTMQLLKKMSHDLNKTIIVSTHELPLAEKYSDRFLMMSQSGNILYTDCWSTDIINSLFAME